MAFPFSAVSTPFRVTRQNGQRYFANCAWESIAFHPMLGEPIRVDSFCHHCGSPLTFRTESNRGVPRTQGLPIVYLGLSAALWWRDVVRTCANTMVFFDSESHLEAWRGSRPVSQDAALPVDQAIQLSIPIYSGKMRLDYERPSPAALHQEFERLGLTGAFWEL